MATLASARWESATARTLVFDVPGWPGHLAGQHVDVKLTAEDGYSAQRSYSIASAPGNAAPGGAATLELTVQRLDDGEVSPYLTDVLEPGDHVELRGPIGGWFVWRPSPLPPLQLIAGGSGIVPLMAMIRAAQPDAGQAPAVPLRLLYSARTPADVIYSGDLAQRARAARFSLSYALTRARPPAAPAAPPADPSARVAGNGQSETAPRPFVSYGRISGDVIAAAAWEPRVTPAIFICGPSGFVEAAADLLIAAGHDPAAIKTERFGATGLGNADYGGAVVISAGVVADEAGLLQPGLVGQAAAAVDDAVGQLRHGQRAAGVREAAQQLELHVAEAALGAQVLLDLML